MQKLMLTLWLCVFLLTLVAESESLRWTWAGPDKEVCAGDKLTIPWNFKLNRDEQVHNITWYLQKPGMARTMVAFTNAGQGSGHSVCVVPDASLSMCAVHQDDSGRYSVVVTTNRAVHLAIASDVTVSVPFVTQGASLHATVSARAVQHEETGVWHVQLKCGKFVSLGSPAVAVVWKTPSGDTVESTSYSEGYFYLELENPVEGGRYTCEIPESRTSDCAVAKSRSQSLSASVDVDPLVAQIPILVTRMASLQSDLDQQEEENDDLKTTVAELRRSGCGCANRTRQVVQLGGYCRCADCACVEGASCINSYCRMEVPLGGNCSHSYATCSASIPNVVCDVDRICRRRVGEGEDCSSGVTVCSESLICHSSGVCGSCEYNLTEAEGVLQSTNFPNYYPHDTNCTYYIRVAEGNHVELQFSNYSVEGCPYDFIRIYEPTNGQMRLMAALCNRYDLPTVQSSDRNVMVVNFRSDGSATRTGFRATYRTVAGELTRVGPGQSCSADNTICSSPSTCQHGYCRLPVNGNCTGAPNSCSQGLICERGYCKLKAGGNCSRSHSHCKSNLVCDTDKICKRRVERGERCDTGYTMCQYGVFCNPDGICGDCGANFTDIEGSWQSYNYPNSYINSLNCYYRINAPEGHKIILNFTDYVTECCCDYVLIFDGNSTGIRKNGQNCVSTPAYTPSFVSTGNRVVVYFRTDGSVVSRGFNVSYKSVRIVELGGDCTVENGHCAIGQICDNGLCKIDTNSRCNGSESFCRTGHICEEGVCKMDTGVGDCSLKAQSCKSDLVCASTNVCVTCGGTFTGQQGIVESPSYPLNYPNHADCEYLIRVPAGHTIRLNVTDFLTEICPYDTLTIYDGNSEAADSLGEFCGSSFNSSVTSTGRTLFLHFETDDSVSYRGFHAMYTAVSV